MKMALENGLEKTTENQGYKELVQVSPILFRESLARGKKMMFGKISEENNPFDVIIAEEDEVYKSEGRGSVRNLEEKALLIQVKEIFEKEPVTTTLTDWIAAVNKRIEKARIVVMKPEGVLLLHNSYIADGFTWKEFVDSLRQIRFSNDYPYRQVVISVGDQDDSPMKSRLHAWQLYPTFESVGSVTHEEVSKLKEIYDLP